METNTQLEIEEVSSEETTEVIESNTQEVEEVISTDIVEQPKKKRIKKKRNASKNSRKGKQTTRTSYKKSKLNSSEYKSIKNTLKALEQNTSIMQTQFRTLATIITTLYSGLESPIEDETIINERSNIVKEYSSVEKFGTDEFMTIEDSLKVLVVFNKVSGHIESLNTISYKTKQIKAVLSFGNGFIPETLDIMEMFGSIVEISTLLEIYHKVLKDVFTNNNDKLMDTLNVMLPNINMTTYEKLKEVLDIKISLVDPEDIEEDTEDGNTEEQETESSPLQES